MGTGVSLPSLDPALDDYGLVGNLHTAALVSRFGSVDWACFPRFSSPSVFARLLDGRRGGYQSVVPLEAFRSRQAYRPSSAVLETRFELSDHRQLVVTDVMPVLRDSGPEGAPMLLREVRAFGGSVGIETRFEPRFDYGARPAEIVARGGEWEARSNGDALRYSHPMLLRVTDGRAVGSGIVRPELPLEIEVSWGTERPVRTGFAELVEHTDQFWRRWTHVHSAPFHQYASAWHRWVERSEITLKLLSNVDTGAFIAAPTTSVPEWPGGSRNWDYRYVWIRDAAFSAQAMLDLGHLTESRSFLRWVLERLREDGRHRLRVVYGAHGEGDLAERRLTHLRGMWGSRPVRVGNAAAQQFQLDIYGELLDCALVLEGIDRSAVDDHWNAIAGLADEVVRLWRRPDRGIWEIRGLPKQFVHSKLMAWVALDRAARLGHPREERATRDRWKVEAERVREWILTDGFDPRTGSFRQAAGSSEVDAANLRVPLVGFLPYDDPRVVGTVDRVQRELARGAFVYRYRTPDGIPGDEGAFLPTSFWLVECLARGGRTEEALESWGELLAAGTSLGLFSEEFDPRNHLRIGNFPQALTHIGLLRAARALGEMRPYRAEPVPRSASPGSRRSPHG